MSTASTDITRHLPVEVAFGRLFVSLFLGFTGIALTLAAFGLWIVPGAGGLPGVSLMKMGISLFLLVSGMSCIVIARSRYGCCV